MHRLRVIDLQEPPETNEKRSDGDEGKGNFQLEGVKQIIPSTLVTFVVFVSTRLLS